MVKYAGGSVECQGKDFGTRHSTISTDVSFVLGNPFQLQSCAIDRGDLVVKNFPSSVVGH